MGSTLWYFGYSEFVGAPPLAIKKNKRSSRVSFLQVYWHLFYVCPDLSAITGGWVDAYVSNSSIFDESSSSPHPPLPIPRYSRVRSSLPWSIHTPKNHEHHRVGHARCFFLGYPDTCQEPSNNPIMRRAVTLLL